jgi:hypothetical protein
LDVYRQTGSQLMQTAIALTEDGWRTFDFSPWKLSFAGFALAPSQKIERRLPIAELRSGRPSPHVRY